MDLSPPPLARVRPVGSKATLMTPPLCPLSVRIRLPVSPFHRRIVASAEGDASIPPSGDQAMRPITPVCPDKECSNFTPGGSFGGVVLMECMQYPLVNSPLLIQFYKPTPEVLYFYQQQN